MLSPPLVIVPLGLDQAPELHELWLASVRATHIFLTTQDIADISPDVQAAFSAVRLYGILHDETPKGSFIRNKPRVAAFMGISPATLEMLFVHPDFFRRGYGTALVQYALTACGVQYVDVNEQNPNAVAFYSHMGFAPMGRDAVDAQGRPFPIIHLRHSAPLSTKPSK